VPAAFLGAMGSWRAERIAKTFHRKENRASFHHSVALSHGPLAIIHCMRYKEGGLKSAPTQKQGRSSCSGCCMLESRRRTGREFHADIECENRSPHAARDVTAQVQKAVASSGVGTGICYLYVPHTTAAITSNECADRMSPGTSKSRWTGWSP